MSSENIKMAGLETDDYVEQNRLSQVEKLANNYVIVTKILDELDYKDQQRCAQTCRLWCDVVSALRRRNLRCYDYIVIKQKNKKNIILDVSRHPVLAPPMVSFTFCNDILFAECKYLSPSPCEPACQEEHSVIYLAMKNLLTNNSNQLTVYGTRPIYRPLSTSHTYQYTVHKQVKTTVYGLYLPKIPNVRCDTFQYFEEETNRTSPSLTNDIIDGICEENIVKGVIVFVEERILLYPEACSFNWLKYFKQKQPDVPFALGGCVVQSAFRGPDMDTLDDCAMVAVFSVPRRAPRVPGARIHFEMFSLIVPKATVKKEHIRDEIKKFAASVPDMQFSACLKFSCVGRDHLHRLELDVFREIFPRTTIVGCYGDGEIGYNHPALNRDCPPSPKKSKLDKIHYTYSTVFVYFCWGKLIKPADNIV